jgi:hypothetical protein
VLEKTSTTITLTWPRYYQSGPSNHADQTTYELQHCPPSTAVDPATGLPVPCVWANLKFTTLTTFTHTGLSEGLLYKYRVRAECLCKEAEWSDEECVELQAPALPPIPSCPRRISGQCMDFSFSWSSGASLYDTGRDLPNNYIVEIRAADGTWVEYDCDIWGQQTSCPLSTMKLMAAPYKLKNNAVVAARVTAENNAGRSLPAYDSCVGDTIRTKACKP